jgi:hypothetical protein
MVAAYNAHDLLSEQRLFTRRQSILPARFVGTLVVYVLVAFAYCLVPYVWAKLQRYPVTGDEPHYLVIADSILNDGDLDVSNNYASWDCQYLYYRGPLGSEGHVVSAGDSMYSVHGIGVPIAVALPAKLGGRYARHVARLGMATLNAVGAPIFMLLLVQLGASIAASAVFTTCVFIAMPFIAGANQLFPDMLAGIATFMCLSIAHLAGDGKHRGPLAPFVYIVIACSLPFLHIKYSLGSVVLAAIGAVRFTQLRGDRSWSTWGYILPPALLGGLFLFLNYKLYGSALGPYAAIENASRSVAIAPEKNASVWLALLFDQAHGMLVQQPLFWTAFLGLGSLWRHQRSLAVALVLLHTAMVLPNAMHPVWFGGWSFVGRFGWPGLGVLLFLSAHGLLQACRILGPRLVAVVSIFAALYQVRLAGFWMIDGFLLQRAATLPAWLYNSMLPELVGFMPALYEDPCLGVPLKGWLFLAIGCVVVYSGIVAEPLQVESKKRCALYLLAALAIIALCMPQSKKYTIDVPAAEFDGEIGERRGGAKYADGASGDKWIVFGPFWRLPAGKYRAKWYYQLDRRERFGGFTENVLQQLPEWDFCVPLNTVQQHGVLHETNSMDKQLEFVFEIDAETAFYPVEFRIKGSPWYNTTLSRFVLETAW